MPTRRLKNWGLTELFSESNEPPFDEVPLEEPGGAGLPSLLASISATA
jgi:hypothetical protein